MDTKNICRHIAIIMDGNGRWAKKEGCPELSGIKKERKTLLKLLGQ